MQQVEFKCEKFINCPECNKSIGRFARYCICGYDFFPDVDDKIVDDDYGEDPFEGFEDP